MRTFEDQLVDASRAIEIQISGFHALRDSLVEPGQRAQARRVLPILGRLASELDALIAAINDEDPS